MAGESDGLKMKPLYEKLWKILKAVERIEKDKHNQQGGYKYASESAIKEALHPLFAEHGLVLRPADMDQVSFTPPSGDKKSYITTLKIRFELIDLESGEFMPLVILASGGDTLDKGTFKAITGALKYALTTLFLIPTGDDPEANAAVGATERPRPRAKQDPEATISAEQVSRLWAICKTKKIDEAFARDVIVEAGYASSRDIKAKDYEAIIEKLGGK